MSADAAAGAGVDPLALAEALIACPSVTPEDGGAQRVLAAFLAPLGFTLTPLRFGAVENLFARHGRGRPHLCFAGHTDVVPPGAATWAADPFTPTVRAGVLYGRGACDMKGAIAAFAAACAGFLAGGGGGRGSISLLITGDEEGLALDGTRRVLDWLRSAGELPDFCLVGEPTNPARLGETIKIGRRGSLNLHVVAEGRQGHVAYPERAENPLHPLLAALAELASTPLDAGTAHFAPSSLQITSVDVGNPTANLIPARAEARLNIRFNDAHTAAALEARVRGVLARHLPRFTLEPSPPAEAFVTAPGAEIALLCAVIEAETGLTPRLDTGGGTSDARFLAPHCPVAEFGLVGASMHQVDECVPLADLRRLTAIYRAFLAAYFAPPARAPGR